MNKIQYSNLSARQVICLLLVIWILCFLYVLPACAEGERALQVPNSLTDLLISGDNTLRFEHYNTSGDESSSQYQFEGPQTYNQFSLNFNKRDTPYTTWRGRAYGVINESDYRVKDRGFVPERLNLTYEKGDFALPFRVEAGDYYHYYSQRTIQRSLKGIQLELQPDIGSSAGRRLSIQFASGAKQSTWKDFRLTDDLTKGVSLLFEDSIFGLWNLNFVHNTRKGSRHQNTLHRSQEVIGLAMEKTIRIGNQKITFEGEFDQFNGDHNGVSGGAVSGIDRDENGIYVQLSGKSDLPLTYRFQFEDYGQDYRPNGAVVTPDRRSGEAHVGWRFKSGLKVQGRLQHYNNGVETFDPVDTDIIGIALSGPFLKGIVNDLSGNINAYLQDVESRNSIRNSITQTINASFNKPVYGGWNGRLDIFYQDVNTQLSRSNDSVTRQAKLSADHALNIYDFQGNVAPGVMVRQIDSMSGGTDDVYPTLAVNLKKGSHNFGYNMGVNIQDRRGANNTDFNTLTQNFSYRYTMKNDTYGLEINSADRNPDPGSVSKSFLAAVYWTHQIGGKIRFKKSRKRAAKFPSGVYTPGFPASGRMIDMSELSSGVDMKTIKERLARANITGANELGNMIIYEVALLDEIEQRQRLVLEYKEDVLQKSALIIEFDDIGDSNGVMQTFERMRKELLDKYGNPDNFFEEGEFSANLVDDINSGKFIRIMEWYRPEGIIRYGIPRRLDKQIRMEVQFADSLPPENDTMWSIERVR